MQKRREFIQNGLGFVAAGLSAPSFSSRADAKSGQNNGGARPLSEGKILVIIEMAGGNDGLNTVVPYTNGAYAAARPTIGLKAREVVKISSKLGLHPAMQAMGRLFEKGQVAVVCGVGYADANRSHFDSMDIWQSGQSDLKQNDRSGWLGRYLSEGQNNNPLGGIVLGDSLPLALSARHSAVSIIGAGSDLGFEPQNARHRQMQALHSLYGANTGAAPTEFISAFDHDIYSSAEPILHALGSSDKRAHAAAKYPQSELANKLQTVVKLVHGNLGTRVFYISIGGFDTHQNQPASHARLLGTMSEAIAAFYRDLALQGLDNDVMLLTFSEFGRRVGENSTSGTDHGAASTLFVVGGQHSSVRGGIFGTYPDLSDLDSGDLKCTTDFRSVYASLLDRWLGGDSTRIFGARYETLKFV